MRPKITFKRWIAIIIALLLLGGVGALVGVAGLYYAHNHVMDAAQGTIFSKTKDVPKRYVVIVPGAAVYKGGRVSSALEDRLSCALSLYKAGKVKRVLVSGDHGKRAYDEVNVMGKWLIKRGVSKQHVFFDHAGFRTFDTMVRASKVFEVNDAAVCTQAFHLPRSVFLAKQAGIDAVGLKADRRQYSDHRKNSLREVAARLKAVLDVYVLGTEPKFLGEPIPITGSPEKTRG